MFRIVSIRSWFCLAGLFCGWSCDGPSPAPQVPSRQTIVQKPGAPAEEFPPPRPSTDADWFSDETKSSGVEFAYRNGEESGTYSMIESFGGGVAMFDFDRDGDLDLLFTGGGAITPDLRVRGHALKLFRNEGDFRFVDVGEACGLTRIEVDYSHGCTVADYDRDGWPDVFVTTFGRSLLLRNDHGTFRDVTADSGIAAQGWNTACCWGDFDGDGWPDLYVGGYLKWTPRADEWCGDATRQLRDVCAPRDLPPAPDRLFLNGRDGTFRDATETVGLRADGKAMGAVAADFDSDGRLDLYVANDVSANHLYLNEGAWPWHDSAHPAGVSGNEVGVPEGSMGVDCGDFDGDGRMDLFVTNYETEDNSLYRNLEAGVFVHSTVVAGLSGVSRPWVGFATEFADFDLDGWLDLYVMNGHVVYHTRRSAYRQPCQLFRNQEGRRFQEVSEEAAPWFTARHVARGAAAGDLDDDGDLDLVVVEQNSDVSLLRNRKNPKNWIRFELVGTQSSPDAVGAQIEIPFENRTLTRVVRGGGSYLSQADRRVPVPTAGDDPVTVRVRWLGGKTEEFAGLATRRTHTLREGQGRANPGSTSGEGMK